MITKQQVKQIYEKLKVEYGRGPTRDEVAFEGNFDSTMINHLFGSYQNLCKIFKDNCYTINVTKESLVKKYKDLKQKLGRIPKRVEVYTGKNYEKRFGKWNDFVKEMGDIPPRNTYSREQLIIMLKNFYKLTGKIPDVEDMKRPNHRVFQNEFGSWQNALNQAGFKSCKGKYISKDGHICDSKSEVMIDNLMYKMSIPHTKSENYPVDNEYNKNGKKKCDWKVGDTYVEFLGYINHRNPIVQRKYEKKTNEKFDMCMKNGWNFMFISPDNTANLIRDIKNIGGI
jgi:hypothetical protein